LLEQRRVYFPRWLVDEALRIEQLKNLPSLDVWDASMIGTTRMTSPLLLGFAASVDR
jgi:hypothetical protein